MDVFIARQPILDRQRQLCAYELLFRADAGQNAFDGVDGAAATTRLIANALLATGLESLLGGKKAFINFDRSLLLGGLHSVLPPEVLVIEVLETVDPDSEVLAACQKLCEQGYALAMDDFVPDPRFEPLARLARLIKVDLLATARPDQERILRKYQPLGIEVLAEKVETQEEFQWALDAGYNYFQGYFFARPEMVRGRRIPASKLTCIRLLTEAQQTEPDFERFEKLVSGDVSLSYSLLIYVNSALFSRANEIRSIRQAIAVLGQDGIRHWAVLAALPMMAKDKPGELVTLSLVRARFCERIAGLAGVPHPDRAFLMGLFSLLDGLIDLPLREALAKVHADPAITDALTETAPPGGRYGDVYQIARRYEAGDWDAAAARAATSGIKASQLAEAYAESAFWAQQALHATSRKTNVRRHVRYAAAGELRLRWQEPGGRERAVPATIMNASAEGLQVQASEAIPVRACVTCQGPKLRISGRGTVRYCTFVKGKYLIGIEFRGGTGWPGPAAM